MAANAIRTRFFVAVNAAVVENATKRELEKNGAQLGNSHSSTHWGQVGLGPA
jgi:hypothetical protein